MYKIRNWVVTFNHRLQLWQYSYLGTTTILWAHENYKILRRVKSHNPRESVREWRVFFRNNRKFNELIIKLAGLSRARQKYRRINNVRGREESPAGAHGKKKDHRWKSTEGGGQGWEAAKKWRRGRRDPASSGGWCTSTRRWQPHPVLSGTGARTQRNAFPGVYLTVPRYIRQMIDRHQCFSTNAPYRTALLISPTRGFFFYYFITAVGPSPGIASSGSK